MDNRELCHLVFLITLYFNKYKVISYNLILYSAYGKVSRENLVFHYPCTAQFWSGWTAMDYSEWEPTLQPSRFSRPTTTTPSCSQYFIINTILLFRKHQRTTLLSNKGAESYDLLISVNLKYKYPLKIRSISMMK